MRPGSRCSGGSPLQHATQTLGARLHQPDRLRTAISYAGRRRIANGVHASGESPVESMLTPCSSRVGRRSQHPSGRRTDLIPRAVRRPTPMSFIDGLAAAVPLREVPPRYARAHAAHRSKAVRAWLADHKDESELHFLPSYSPAQPGRAGQRRPQTQPSPHSQGQEPERTRCRNPQVLPPPTASAPHRARILRRPTRPLHPRRVNSMSF